MFKRYGICSVNPLRDLINQFRSLYLPVVQLNLDEVALDEVFGIVHQLEQAARMLDAIACQVESDAAISIEDAQLLFYQFSKETRIFFALDPKRFVLFDCLVPLDGRIKSMRARLDYLQKDFRRFCVLPRDTAERTVQATEDDCCHAPFVESETQTMDVVPYDGRIIHKFISLPVTDIYVDDKVQPQVKFRFSRWAYASSVVAAHALIFGAFWLITRLCSPIPNSAK